MNRIDEETREAAISAAAERLRIAAAQGEPCAPVRELLALDDVEGAYRVQQINVARQIAVGRRRVGRKIGLTSPAVQTQLGVDQPDYGVLLADMMVPDGGVLRRGEVLQPKAEAEIAFVLGADLDMPTPSFADVLRATQFVLPAIEIVGSRIAGWDIRFVDTVADNASSGMFALGTPARRPEGFDFAGCTMEMRLGGEVVSTGRGRACLGNPVNAVVWLAARMHEAGAPLRAGEIILSGALGAMAPLDRAGTLSARIEGLGEVAFEYGD